MSFNTVLHTDRKDKLKEQFIPDPPARVRGGVPECPAPTPARGLSPARRGPRVSRSVVSWGCISSLIDDMPETTAIPSDTSLHHSTLLCCMLLEPHVMLLMLLKQRQPAPIALAKRIGLQRMAAVILHVDSPGKECSKTWATNSLARQHWQLSHEMVTVLAIITVG